MYICYMKIGNIINCDNIETKHLFNCFNDITEIDNNLPTLIIGFKEIKKSYPYYNILDRKINENLYWTFGKHEKRDLMEEDIYYFSIKCYDNIIKNVEYFYINPTLSKKNILKIIKKILNGKKIITYKKNDIYYIYCDNIVFGLDLYVLKFFCFNVEKIISKIDKISDVILTNNDIIIEYKDFIEKNENKISLIPYLYSLDEKKTTISDIHQ